MLSIKHAAIADIPLIRELAMQVWPQTYTPIIGDAQVAYMLGQFYTPSSLQEQMEAGHQFIICCSGPQPVAFAAWSLVAPGVYKLHKIYIIPGQQGKGMGRFMLGHITTALKAKEATALILNVNRYNTAARAFYEKTGFEHVADEDIDIGSGYFMNDYILRLEIK